MSFVRAIVVATLSVGWVASSARAVTGALCIRNTLNGPLRLRATACRSNELQIGSFDGTTLQFSGINVQVVSGSGATRGAVNGKGNLIVGYNEGTLGQTRTGSHNLVVGDEHEYTSFGGFVAGFRNTVNAPSASVSGGGCNVAGVGPLPGACSLGPGSMSVSGGAFNLATGNSSSVSGGSHNGASAYYASVSGGVGNMASGNIASVSGGAFLTQPTAHGWAAGSATGNTISGDFASP